MAIQPSSTERKNMKQDRAPSKQALQRQIGRTRESLSETVEEIKQTAEQGYASAKETVAGLADYREEFQKEPLVWSLGALSAGFALGYTLGYAHKASKKGKHSQFGQFAERTINELSTVGQRVVMPALNLNIKDIFGVDFAELLQNIRGGDKTRRKSAGTTRRLKSGGKRSSSTKRSKGGKKAHRR